MKTARGMCGSVGTVVAGFVLVLLAASPAPAIPATPLMTVYEFNGPLEIPYYDIKTSEQPGPSSPAGSLAQGTAVVPCLVLRDGRPLTDNDGTPYVGFEVVVDSRTATPASAGKFDRILRERRTMSVPNHHCAADVHNVIDARKLVAAQKAPFFDPPPSAKHLPAAAAQGSLADQIVRTFHNSTQCAAVNHTLTGRREALRRAWNEFAAAASEKWPADAVRRARLLDYTMRTAIVEGHFDRGCSAYGACERNIIALSIRNRGRERCLARQGCAEVGDFEGVSSKPAEYNIWDEYRTQISAVAGCFLRDDLAGRKDAASYRKYRAMYEQNVQDVERILFGGEGDLEEIFPNTARDILVGLRNYYHPPAMGKCFPNDERVLYVSGAVARRESDFALIAGANLTLRASSTNPG